MVTENLQPPTLNEEKLRKTIRDRDRVFPFQFKGPASDCLSEGLSKREYCASLILSALISHSGVAGVNGHVIDQAIRGADLFLEAIGENEEFNAPTINNFDVF